MTRYILRLFTEYDGKLVNIERKGRDKYIMHFEDPNKRSRYISREELEQDREVFETNCRKLLEDQLDPNFSLAGIEFSVVKVISLGGLKFTYLLSSDIYEEEDEDDYSKAGGIPRISSGLTRRESSRFLCKGYIVANKHELAVHEQELQLLKLA